MARKKNASFVGASILDVDVDALTYTHTIANAIGDTARIFDRVTGQNGHSASDTINHDGTAGRGSLLGVPIASQWVGREITLTAPVLGKDGSPGSTWLVAVPVFIPPGETELTVEVVGSRLDDWNLTAYFRTSAWATVGDQTEVTLDDKGQFRGGDKHAWRADFTGLTSGLRYFFIEATSTAANGNGYVLFSSWALYAKRKSAVPNVSPRRAANDFGVTTPAALEGLANVPFDAALFANREALHGYLTAYENRNQNALEEYITGWPCGGNANYTHVDHDGFAVPDASNPSRSRFMAHTRSLYTAEPEIAWPLWCEAFGAFKTDGGLVVDAVQPPTLGMLKWYAPWSSSGALTTMRQLQMQYPDFQSGTSRLKMACLVGFDVGTIGDWDAVVGGVTGAFSATFSGMPSGNCLAVATGSALAFTGDAQALHTLQLVKTRAAGAARAIKSCTLLGSCLYFEP